MKWGASLATGGGTAVGGTVGEVAIVESLTPVAGAGVAAAALPVAAGTAVGVGSFLITQRLYRGYKYMQYHNKEKELIKLQDEDRCISQVLTIELQTVSNRVDLCLRSVKKMCREKQLKLEMSSFGELCKQVLLNKSWKLVGKENETARDNTTPSPITGSLPNMSLPGVRKSFQIMEYLIPIQNAMDEHDFATGVSEATGKIRKDLQDMKVWIKCINMRLTK